MPESVYENTFARLLGDDPQDFSGLVAESGGALVGLTHYLFHRHCWKIENVCYLQDLYAAPFKVRGQTAPEAPNVFTIGTKLAPGVITWPALVRAVAA